MRQYGNDILIVAGVCAFLAAVLRANYKANKFFMRLEVTMQFVERELKPNGGGSMRDAIDKLVHRTENLEAIVRPPRKETR